MHILDYSFVHNSLLRPSYNRQYCTFLHQHHIGHLPVLFDQRLYICQDGCTPQGRGLNKSIQMVRILGMLHCCSHNCCPGCTFLDNSHRCQNYILVYCMVNLDRTPHPRDMQLQADNNLVNHQQNVDHLGNQRLLWPESKHCQVSQRWGW